jgi:CRP-like cAMP-binding protein
MYSPHCTIYRGGGKAGSQWKMRFRPGVLSSRNLQSKKEKIEGAVEFSLLAYSGGLCTVPDTIRTLSGIVSLGHTDSDRVLSESEDPLRTSGFKNTLLNALDEDIVARLRLKPVQFELKHEIESSGNPIDHLYFLEAGMASMTTTFKDGSQVEVGMFGFESVIGVSALMGTKKSLNRVYTQIAGHGYSCRVEDARREFRLGGDFQSLALRYVQAQLVQATQSAGCNAKHNFEQRLARWLLICADRANIDTFKISQEFLADMLGVRRPTVSTTAGTLKRKGIIQYTRGEIRILDVPRLTKTSCECYLIIKDYLDNYTKFDTAITE